MPAQIPQGINGHPYSDDGLLIPLGAYTGISSINKFGTNHDIGTDYEHVWEQEGLWVPMPAATLVECASTSANDTATGSGAQSMVIQGLGPTGLSQQDSIVFDGTTPVVSNLLFSFINRAFIYTVGSSGFNEGTLYIADDSTDWGGTTPGVPDTAAAIQAEIHAEDGQTQQMIYTVPFDKTGYVTGGYISADGSKVCTYQFFMVTRDTVADATGVKRVAFEATVTGGSFIKPFHPYVEVPGGSTALVQAKVDVGTAAVSSGLDIILVDINRSNP